MTTPSALASIANPGTQTDVLASTPTSKKATPTGSNKLSVASAITSKNEP